MTRRLLVMIALLLAVVLPASAQAKPTLVITLQSDGEQISLGMTGASGALRCSPDQAALTACAVDAANCAKELIYEYEPPPARPPSFNLIAPDPESPVPTWLVHILSDPDQELWCAPPAPAGPAPKTVTPEETAITVEPGGTITVPSGIDPEGDAPNTLVWGSWTSSIFRRIWSKVGASPLTNCQLTAAGAGACSGALGNSATSAGTKLISITYQGNVVRSGSVKFALGRFHFEIPIRQCLFSPQVGRLKSLLAGADLQLLEIDGGAPCGARLRGQRLQLHSGNVVLLASRARLTASGSVLLELQKIPESVAGGTWLLETDTGTRVGTIALDAIAKPIAVRATDGVPALAVHYDVSHDGTLDLDQWHDGKSVNGRAVVTTAQGEYFRYIQNTATIVLDTELTNAARALANPSWDHAGARALPKSSIDCSDHPTTCDDLDQKAQTCAVDNLTTITPTESVKIDECHARRGAWRVRPHNWQDPVWLREGGLWWKNVKPVFADELGELTFAVFQPQPHPLQVVVELVVPDFPPGRETVLFRDTVTLANGAQAESLPLPLARALYIECGHHAQDGSLFPRVPPETDADSDVVLNGFTRAVRDEDVLTGGCRLHYSPRIVARLFGNLPRKKALDLLKYYGRQELTVTVRRGEANETKNWSIDPVLDQELELPVPKDAKNAIGIYSVTAALRGPLPPSVTWRGRAPQGGDASLPALSDLEFHANLRPRGPFGWKVAPLRMFMTFPISFTGVRFPARPSEMPRSSSLPNAQVTKIQAGALLAVEPWNYDTGQNPWPVPTRFMTGMNFYNASDGEFAPSLLTGLSFTLPIVNLQKGVAEDQLGSDLALGLFWESDIGRSRWLATGNHFLITFGVNLLSLFGSK